MGGWALIKIENSRKDEKKIMVWRWFARYNYGLTWGQWQSNSTRMITTYQDTSLRI